MKKSLYLIILFLSLAITSFSQELTILNKRPQNVTIDRWNKGSGLSGLNGKYTDDYLNKISKEIMFQMKIENVYEIIAYMYNDKLSIRFDEKQGGYKRVDVYISTYDGDNWKIDLGNGKYVYIVDFPPKLPSKIK